MGNKIREIIRLPMKEDVLPQRGKTISHDGASVRKTAEEVTTKTADHHNKGLFPATTGISYSNSVEESPNKSTNGTGPVE